jgi:glycosyltransferase involved in cell wall biosynthesis
VGTIEGRKNHLALLDAAAALWRRGLRFELQIVGLAQRETGRAALARLHRLQADGLPVRYDGPVPADALEAAYRRCTFTVYPSLMEGFGLPVLESLARGRPCICSARGALGESAQGGGCLALPTVDAAGLAAAMERLLTDRTELDRLAAAARARRFRSWSDYVADLTGWMRTLSGN